MSNPFEEILTQLKTISDRLSLIEIKDNAVPKRIVFKAFCKAHQISRVTGYAWRDRGLIQLEKIGGRQYVKSDSIKVDSKYQRESSHA